MQPEIAKSAELGNPQSYEFWSIPAMPTKPTAANIAKFIRRAKALAEFGTFAFREADLQTILQEAARVCATCLGAPFSKVCRYRPSEDDLLVVAGHGWNLGVVGFATSVADETSPQGRAFITGNPQVCANIEKANAFTLPSFYPEHSVLSTVDVLVAAKTGPPFGVLEIDSRVGEAFDEQDIDFLTGFANILAEAVVTSERAENLRRTIERMEELIAEKDVLSQELKHRVRNSLHLVYGLLTAELGDTHSAASLAAFRSIALRVMGLAEVFDHLLGVGMTKVINFGDYVAALCINLPDLYREKNITLTCETEPLRIGLDDATALGIIVTELVNNAYMHAFPGGSGEISVILKIPAGEATLTIADNGVGFVEVETRRRGMGLVRRLIQQIGGTLSVQSDCGTRWTIRFPIAEALPRTAA
jgi:two-component sensor histidine kinase